MERVSPVQRSDVVEFKAYYQSDSLKETEIRRFKSVPSWGSVIDKLRSFYGENLDFNVKYKDEEGDLVRISSDPELEDCVRLASPFMRLYVRGMYTSRQQSAHQRDVSSLRERHMRIYQSFVEKSVPAERREEYLRIFAYLESVGYGVPMLNTTAVGRVFHDAACLPALMAKLSDMYERRMRTGGCGKADQSAKKQAAKLRRRDEKLKLRAIKLEKKREAEERKSEDISRQRMTKGQAKQARAERDLIKEGFHPLPPRREGWPEGITHLLMDGNNMLFVTSFLRRLVTGKQLAKAEAVLALLTSASAERLRLTQARLVFDACTNTFTKQIAGAGTEFHVQGASPEYATADDMIASWAKGNRSVLFSTLFVTSDRGLSKRLRSIEPSTRVIRPQEFLIFISVLLGDDLLLEPAISGPSSSAFDEFLSRWVRQRLEATTAFSPTVRLREPTSLAVNAESEVVVQ